MHYSRFQLTWNISVREKSKIGIQTTLKLIDTKSTYGVVV